MSNKSPKSWADEDVSQPTDDEDGGNPTPSMRPFAIGEEDSLLNLAKSGQLSDAKSRRILALLETDATPLTRHEIREIRKLSGGTLSPALQKTSAAIETEIREALNLPDSVEEETPEKR